MTKLANITKGIAALLAMAAILTGIPWLLWTFGGAPGLQIVDALTDELASSNQLLGGRWPQNVARRLSLMLQRTGGTSQSVIK